MPTLKETPATYASDRALTGETLLEAHFELPQRYAWFNELTTQERLDFFAGLLETLVNPVLVLPNGKRRTRQAALDEYLRGWAATAEIESGPELMQSIQAGKTDLRHGRILSYAEVFNDVPR
jgi:hypothetical protein